MTIPTPANSGRTGLAIAAALLCFSAGPIGIAVQKLLVATLSPFFIVAVQMTLGAAILWLIRLAFPARPVPRSAIAKGLALGVLHPGAFMIVYATASANLDSLTAVLLLAFVPALVAIGGRIALGEALKPAVMIGIIVCTFGLGVLAAGRESTGDTTALGLFLGLTGLAIAASGVIAARALNTGAILPWFLLAPLQVTGAAITSWLGVLATGVPIDASRITENAAAFAYLAIGMTATGYLTYNFAVSRLTTPTLGLLSATGPGIGAIAAAILFGTAITLSEAAGIAIILAGSALPPLWALFEKRTKSVTAPSRNEG